MLSTPLQLPEWALRRALEEASCGLDSEAIDAAINRARQLAKGPAHLCFTERHTVADRIITLTPEFAAVLWTSLRECEDSDAEVMLEQMGSLQSRPFIGEYEVKTFFCDGLVIACDAHWQQSMIVATQYTEERYPNRSLPFYQLRLRLKNATEIV